MNLQQQNHQKFFFDKKTLLSVLQSWRYTGFSLILLLFSTSPGVHLNSIQ